MKEVEQAEPDDEDQMDCGAGIFQGIDLYNEAALGGITCAAQ